MKLFDLNFLDHVAIYVNDMEESIKWYAEVLGLETYKLKEWGDFPVFMLSGKTGIAIFPANMNDEKLNFNSKNTKIDHFAFNVSKDDFQKAQAHFSSLDIDFDFQDHFYFHSVYLRDPDDHKVELTTIVVDENNFY